MREKENEQGGKYWTSRTCPLLGRETGKGKGSRWRFAAWGRKRRKSPGAAAEMPLSGKKVRAVAEEKKESTLSTTPFSLGQQKKITAPGKKSKPRHRERNHFFTGPSRAFEKREVTRHYRSGGATGMKKKNCLYQKKKRTLSPKMGGTSSGEEVIPLKGKNSMLGEKHSQQVNWTGMCLRRGGKSHLIPLKSINWEKRVGRLRSKRGGLPTREQREEKRKSIFVPGKGGCANSDRKDLIQFSG